MTRSPLKRVSRCGFAALFFVVSSSFSFGQVIVISGTTTSVTATEFWTEQSTLDQQLYQLVAEGSTSDQLNDWMDYNQAAIQSQQTLAVQLGAQSAALPFPYVTTVTISELRLAG